MPHFKSLFGDGNLLDINQPKQCLLLKMKPMLINSTIGCAATGVGIGGAAGSVPGAVIGGAVGTIVGIW